MVADGKDQIVDVSALATLLLPVIGGCLLLILMKLLRGSIAKYVLRSSGVQRLKVRPRSAKFPSPGRSRK